MAQKEKEQSVNSTVDNWSIMQDDLPQALAEQLQLPPSRLLRSCPTPARHALADDINPAKLVVIFGTTFEMSADTRGSQVSTKRFVLTINWIPSIAQ